MEKPVLRILFALLLTTTVAFSAQEKDSLIRLWNSRDFLQFPDDPTIESGYKETAVSSGGDTVCQLFFGTESGSFTLSSRKLQVRCWDGAGSLLSSFKTFAYYLPTTGPQSRIIHSGSKLLLIFPSDTGLIKIIDLPSGTPLKTLKINPRATFEVSPDGNYLGDGYWNWYSLLKLEPMDTTVQNQLLRKYDGSVIRLDSNSRVVGRISIPKSDTSIFYYHNLTNGAVYDSVTITTKFYESSRYGVLHNFFSGSLRPQTPILRMYILNTKKYSVFTAPDSIVSLSFNDYYPVVTVYTKDHRISIWNYDEQRLVYSKHLAVPVTAFSSDGSKVSFIDSLGIELLKTSDGSILSTLNQDSSVPTISLKFINTTTVLLMDSKGKMAIHEFAGRHSCQLVTNADINSEDYEEPRICDDLKHYFTFRDRSVISRFDISNCAFQNNIPESGLNMEVLWVHLTDSSSRLAIAGKRRDKYRLLSYDLALKRAAQEIDLNVHSTSFLYSDVYHRLFLFDKVGTQYSVAVLDSRTLLPVDSIRGASLIGLDISRKGDELLTYQNDLNKLSVVSAKALTEVRSVVLNSGDIVFSAALSPDGLEAAFSTTDGRVGIWQTEVGTLRWLPVTIGISSLIHKYSEDGKYLVTDYKLIRASDGTVIVRMLNTGTTPGEYRGTYGKDSAFISSVDIGELRANTSTGEVVIKNSNDLFFCNSTAGLLVKCGLNSGERSGLFQANPEKVLSTASISWVRNTDTYYGNRFFDWSTDGQTIVFADSVGDISIWRPTVLSQTSIIEPSLESAKVNNVWLYPIPASEMLVLRSIDPSEYERLSIVSGMGETVMRSDRVENRIDIHTLVSGYYQIHLYHRDGTVIKSQFIVVK